MSTNAFDALPAAAHARLNEARDGGVDPFYARHAAATLWELQADLDRATALAAEVTGNPHLSPAGKLDRLARAASHAISETNRRLDALRGHAADARRRATEHATWPTSSMTETDRQARLAGAKSDLAAMLTDAKPEDLTARLRHAIETDADGSVTELLFSQNHDRRVLHQQLGESFAPALAAWEPQRHQMLRDRLPEDRRAALDSLPAHQKLDQAVTIAEHYAAHQRTALEQQVSALASEAASEAPA